MKSVVLKSLSPKFVVSEWVTLNWPVLWLTFGSLRSLPSRIGNLLDMTLKDVEKVLYCEAYIVTDPMETTLEEGQVLSEEAYQNALNEFGPNFKAGMGGEAVRECFEN